MADVLTGEQEQAVHAFLSEINWLQRNRNQPPVERSTAVKFLRARKFDVARALALFSQHELTRRREGLVDLNPHQEPLRSELTIGKFTILSSRDTAGAAIAVFRAHDHHPLKTTHQTTLQGIVYQLDAALENPETQKHGLVFVYDMSDSKYSNFDYDLSQKILTMLKGGYPARLKKVLIVTAPLWFKAPFKILRLFVREKLRDRVFTINIPQLPIHIPVESLPISLGGTLVVDHAAWLARCASINNNRPMTNRHDEDPPPKSPTQDLVVEQEPLEKHPRLCGSPVEPSSSASSGFSDDDSLHCDVGHPALTIDQFVEHVRRKGRQGLVEEYSEIRAKQHDGSFNIARMRENAAKNRYTDVLCFDHSRVLLSQDVGASEVGADYIHANYVDGYKQRNAFISTQGPLPKTAGDFWRMAWEQQCLVIVMTTKVVERGKNKCHQYWEPEPGASAEYDDIQVCTKEVDAGPDFTVTTLDLINRKTEERREICHCQFTSWPDYGNPRNAVHLLEFLSRVRSLQRRFVANMGDTWAGHPRGPPIIVHCSAGIGRTGTFCTLDICISRLEDAGTVDVRGTVERIRSQRAFSIQMPDQYVFCHAALIEHAVRTNLVPSIDLSFLGIHEDDSD